MRIACENCVNTYGFMAQKLIIYIRFVETLIDDLNRKVQLIEGKLCEIIPIIIMYVNVLIAIVIEVIKYVQQVLMW